MDTHNIDNENNSHSQKVITAAAPFGQKKSLIAIAVFFSFHGILFTTWLTRIPEIKAKFALSESALGMVLFIAGLGVVASFLFAGYLIKRFGTRRLVFVTACVTAIGIMLISFANNIYQLVALLFLVAGINTINDIAINEQAVQYEKLFNHKIMARMHGIFSLGVVLAGWFGSLLLDAHVSIKTHFISLCIISLLISTIMAKFLLFNSRKLVDTDKKMLALPDKRLWGLGIIVICSAVIEGGVGDWSGLFLIESLQVSQGISPLGLTSFALFMAFGRLSGDWLVDKFNTFHLIQVMSLTAFSGVLIALFAPYWQLAIAGFGLAGFGVSLLYPLAYRYAGNMDGIEDGYGVASVATMGFMGFLFGPVLIGQIAHISSLKIAMGLLVIATFVVFIRAREFNRE